MYSYNVVYKDEEDLMFDMDCDEIARRGSGYKYKSSECLCYNGAPHSAVLPGTVDCSTAAAHPCMLHAHNSLTIMYNNLKSFKWPLNGS